MRVDRQELQQVGHETPSEAGFGLVPVADDLAVPHCFPDQRNRIERAFCSLKDFRRIATRYDKLARNFLAAVEIAAVILWWT